MITHATMSLSSTSTLKGQLTINLGTKAPLYFDTLKDFVSGRISRQEFDDAVHQVLDSNSLSTSLGYIMVRDSDNDAQYSCTMRLSFPSLMRRPF